MNVVVVTTSYPLAQHSTSGIFINRMIRHLSNNVTTTVVTPCPNVIMPAPQDSTIKVQCFRYAPRKLQLIAHQPGGIPVSLKNHKWLLLILPWLLSSMLITCIRKSLHADLVHANWSYNGVIAGIAGRLTGTPVVTTLRGSDVKRLAESVLERWLMKLCLQLNCRVVTVSEAINELVSEYFPQYRDKVCTIPNGVGSDFLSLPIDKSIERARVRITTIGSLITRKRMDTIIRAAARVSSNTNISLNIIGDGPDLGTLQALSDDIRDKRLSVEFQGDIAPDRIPGKLAETDIFALASQFEGRPNVILEAMAAGLPIVASDIEGIRELIKHEESGLLFKAGDANALAIQLERLVTDSNLRYRLGHAARDVILSKGLTWQQCASDYESLYSSCIGQYQTNSQKL